MYTPRRALSFIFLLGFLTTSLVVYSQTPLQFVAVTPCRLVDTRNPAGEFGGPALQGKASRSFAIPDNQDCKIPATAAAYSLNVTVVPHGFLGYLTVWPTGQSQPVVSTLNSYDGRVKANAAIVPAGTEGAVSFYVTDTTNLVLDIDGYFAPASDTTLDFYPLAPCRVADTRNAPGDLGGPYLTGGEPRDFPVLEASSCNIPSSAKAYSLNFTAVPHRTLGYLTVWPTGQNQPVVSTLNAISGQVTANAAIVPAGTLGDITTYAKDDTDLIIDIDGYFAAPGPGGLSLYPIVPCRVLDTRNVGDKKAFSGALPYPVDVLGSVCAPSSQSLAYVFNATVVPSGLLGYLTLWPNGGVQPVVSTLNALDAAVTSNMAIVPAGNYGTIDAYADKGPTQLILDISSYFAPISTLSITTASLPSATLTYNYTTTLGAIGGAPPYTWSITLDDVPPGLGLDPNTGVISGMPTIAGNYPFTVQVADSQSPPITASAPLSITVNTTPAQLTVVTTLLPSGTQNAAYTAMLAATGGITPYTWSISAGSLPAGLNLNPGTGAITGTPTVVGTSNFTVQVADSNTATATAPLSITINAITLAIANYSLRDGTAGSPYTATLTAIGGVTPYTWSIIVGHLPTGLSLNTSTGAITGTPTVVGTSTFTVQVTDSEIPPASVSAQLSITIAPGVVKITTASLPTGTAGQPYSATLTATGGVTPYAWSLTSGKMPDGLSLNTSSGAITGTPQNVGISNLTFRVTDSETPPVSASKQLTLTINSPGGPGNPGVLKGDYAFVLNGFNSSGAWTLAGSFISDGNGHITSGIVDGNSVTGQPFNKTVSGTYSISSTGLNTMTIHGQSYGPVIFAFVLSASGNGRIIEYDDTTGHGSRGSGVLRKADPTAFSLSRLNGGWVYGMTGAGNSGLRMVNVGVFTLASGNITNGVCDMNEGGTYDTCTFSGSVSTINTQTGRGVSTTQSSNGTTHEAVYVVSAGELVMELIDPVPSGNPLLVGSVLQQTGPFNKGSLNGLSVLYYQDIRGADGLDQSGAMILSANGNGTGNVIAADKDLAGTITQEQTGPATYTVAANGAVTVTSGGGGGSGVPTGFLVGHNHGFFVGTGSNSILGTIEPQSGAPFSNASIAGAYSGGSLPPLDYANGENEVDVVAANGVGALNISGDSSQPWGIDQWFGTIVNYTIASNGRGTAQAQGDQFPAVVYVISPSKFVVLMTQTDAEAGVFEH